MLERTKNLLFKHFFNILKFSKISSYSQKV